MTTLAKFCQLLSLGAVVRSTAAPLLGLALFVLFWQVGAQHVNTSLGKLPGPVQVVEQAQNLYLEHTAQRERAAAFYDRQAQRHAERLAEDPSYVAVDRRFKGVPTFFDQIRTSLLTVLAGFLVASLIAIPLGICMGLSPFVQSALNPLVQVLKPISPLAWLPLVTLVVASFSQDGEPLLPPAFVVSMFTVTLCSLWPTLINTAVGVGNVSSDLNNVSRVLRLGWFSHVRTIVLPSALPMMFTGLRISLGIAWMVLIAAEMLAQNPGLGKFVWDEFQNGSSQSLSRIMVAVLTIGFIGFLLDRIMLLIQTRFDWQAGA